MIYNSICTKIQAYKQRKRRRKEKKKDPNRPFGKASSVTHSADTVKLGVGRLQKNPNKNKEGGRPENPPFYNKRFFFKKKKN